MGLGLELRHCMAMWHCPRQIFSSAARAQPPNLCQGEASLHRASAEAVRDLARAGLTGLARVCGSVCGRSASCQVQIGFISAFSLFRDNHAGLLPGGERSLCISLSLSLFFKVFSNFRFQSSVNSNIENNPYGPQW